MRESELAQLDDTYRQEAEMMLAVDQMPANILETLRHVGQLQNTYIIFSADQGFHMGEYRLARMKLTPYTGSTQIPIIVRGPGVPARTTLDGLALNTDLVPTIADIAGVTPPSFVDGRSLKPLQEREPKAAQNEAWRQAELLEFWPRASLDNSGLEHVNRNVRVPKYRAVRTRELLFSEYFYPDGTGEGELYDLRSDPFELENLYARTDPAVLEALSNYAERLQACSAESCRALENAPPQVF